MTRVDRPPGPKGHFLIGSFPLGQQDPLRTLTTWAGQYGDIFYYRAFNVPVYFLNRPDYLEAVLVTQSQNFIKGRGLQANRLLFGNGLLTSEGEFWQRQRRLAQPAFHRERIEVYGRTMVECALRMIGEWTAGTTIEISREMSRLTLEIVARALFSADLRARSGEVGRALAQVMAFNARGRMLMPLARNLPTPGNFRYHLAVKRLDRIIYDIIRKRREKPSGGDDLLSFFMAARDENGAAMPDRQLRDELMTLILAGHETTALALSWTLYLLAGNPQVEEKLVAELNGVLARRPPEAGDLTLMPYLAAVVKESLRLYPPAFAIARIAVNDCEIGSYRIPAGASVVMSQWVMHRDARFFHNPEAFIPERWLPNAGMDEQTNGRSIPRFAYFPFGGGPRTCIGSSFATVEASLILATILQKFKLTLVPEHRVVVSSAITLRPKYGIRMIVANRT